MNVQIISNECLAVWLGETWGVDYGRSSKAALCLFLFSSGAGTSGSGRDRERGAKPQHLKEWELNRDGLRRRRDENKTEMEGKERVAF